MVLHGNRTDTRKLDVHFQFEGTPTNCLEVAFGRDANTNGVLDVAEIETVYGWRAGCYFIENVEAFGKFAECGIAAVEMRSVLVHDEELAAC